MNETEEKTNEEAPVETADSSAPQKAATETVDGLRVYEVGYLVLPTVAEDEVEAVISDIRSAIEKTGGSFIAEGAPQNTKLEYSMYVKASGQQKTEYDRGYFGWIKFEGTAASAVALKQTLDIHAKILRFIIFKTVREDTRAAGRTMTLREVKRTDTISSATRKGAIEEGDKEEVSEQELDKALQDLTKE